MAALLAACSADASKPLAPIGPWRVASEAEGICSIARDYGAADNPVTVAFRLVPGQPDVGASLRARDNGRGPRRGKAVLILNSGERSAGAFTSAKVPGVEKKLTELTIDRSTLDGLRHASVLILNAEGSTRIAIGGGAAALAALDRCQAKQLASLGVDPALLARNAPVPTPLNKGPAAWISGVDMFEGIENPPQGRVVMLLEIGRDGLVTSCRAIASDAPVLARQGCAMMVKYGRYKPARNARGKPIESASIVKARWVLRDD
jgi:hypothetical protein